jgi:hypothetical protein
MCVEGIGGKGASIKHHIPSWRRKTGKEKK